ncbi:hypothetical protein KDX05_07025 [Burkholderia vietnamiensis]|nr:hypothetical protein [Burkholderia vietnamiensis]MBR8228063.1 hypothetical protein [Burkholderia vietnamiensis]
MNEIKHTPGPWRWEFNRKHKSMQLVGGVPKYDLTVMDFDRWGMGGAVVRLREDIDGMNLMRRLCDRSDWVTPFPGRDHHADWCAGVTHPDMKLIEAAPDMALVLEMLSAEADAGTVMIPSALRLTIDAALIKAGRKAAPEPVRVVTIAGGA